LVRQNFFCSSTPESIVQEVSQQITGSPFRLLRELQFNSLGAPVGKTPILVMAGAQDYDYKPAQQSKVANKLGADFILWQNSGHDIQLDNHAKDSARAAIAWLEKKLL
jgi:pimeloyl-ACP methyl ester carboxylesterase